MGWLRALLGLIFGGGNSGFAAQIRQAYQSKLEADTDAKRLAAEQDMQRLIAASQIAQIEAHDRFSAVRIGRLLIVVPYGVYWASTFWVSTFPAWGWTVLKVPSWADSMAGYLIPAILLGDVVSGGLRRFGPKL